MPMHHLFMAQLWILEFGVCQALLQQCVSSLSFIHVEEISVPCRDRLVKRFIDYLSLFLSLFIIAKLWSVH